MKIFVLIITAMMIIAPNARAQHGECDCPGGMMPYQRILSTYTGTLLAGRASEAWCGTPTMPGVPGNVENAESWNGATLGTQWRVWGMTVDAAGAGMVASSIDPYGNGWVDYVTNYDGGQFWLDGNHFGDGTTDFTGNITYYNVSTRITLVGGVQVGATSNITFNGIFNECDCCYLEFVIANAMRVWDGYTGQMPADYPPFLCGPSGELFDACCIIASISCYVGTEETSWGGIKTLHK
jgi:hypothetical protein